MIIILEGLERTGKTTLAKKFENDGFFYFKDRNHIKNMNHSNIAERLDSTLSFLIEADKNNLDVVMDRFHLSEYIYSIYVRNADKKDLRYIWYIDEILSHLNCKLVLLERDISENYLNQYPNKITESALDELQKQFRYIYDKSFISEKNKMHFVLNEEPDAEFHNRFNSIKNVIKLCFNEKKYDFYLASPFFTKEQVAREEKVKNELRNAGFSVYAPREHGVVGSLADRFFVKSTFDSNVKAINDSKMVLSITDGKDMGTVWESGYAYANKIPIVYYAETLGDNPFNIMLSESAIGICKDIEHLKEMCSTKNFKNRDGVTLNYE